MHSFREVSLSAGNETINQQIAERAYQIYLERGDHGGDAASDWYRAEQEVLGFLFEPESFEAQFERACDEIAENALEHPRKRKGSPRRGGRLANVLTRPKQVS